jgi:hypothetical protein
LQRISSGSAGGQGEAGAGAAARAPAAQAGTAVLRLSKVHLYVEYRSVLRNLNWQVRKGEHWAVTVRTAWENPVSEMLYGDLLTRFGRTDRAQRIRKAHPSRMEAAGRLRLPELRGDYAVTVTDLVQRAGRFQHRTRG